MKTLTTLKIATLSLGMVAAQTQISLADEGYTAVKSVNPGTLKVLSNGKNYTALDYNGKINIVGRIEFDPGVVGFVKSWSLEPVITRGFGIAAKVPGAGFYKNTTSYNPGGTPKSIGFTVVFKLTPETLEASAISMCEAKADALRHQGKSNAQIFASDQQVSFKVEMKGEATATGAGKNNQSWSHGPTKTIKVICSKAKGARLSSAPSNILAPMNIERAVIKLTEIAPPNGTCQVKTTTSILAGKAQAPIKYRYVFGDGTKTGVLTTTTGANKAVVLNHVWDIANGPGPETGSVKVTGISPKFETNTASYSMTCKGATAGGYQSKPSAVRPQNQRLN